jgi:hypothetical protein
MPLILVADENEETRFLRVFSYLHSRNWRLPYATGIGQLLAERSPHEFCWGFFSN